MKFILVLAVAVVSVASALPYEGIKGHRRVIQTPGPIPKKVDITEEEKFVGVSDMVNIYEQGRKQIEEQETRDKFVAGHVLLKEEKQQTAFEQERKRLEEETTGSKLTEKVQSKEEKKQIAVQTQTQTEQEMSEEKQLNFHTSEKMDHTIESHKGDTNISTVEEKDTKYKLESSSTDVESSMLKGGKSTSITESGHGASSVRHYLGVKGGRRYHH